MKRVILSTIISGLLFLVLVACRSSQTDSASQEPLQVAVGLLATIPDEVPVPADNPMTPEKVELGKGCTSNRAFPKAGSYPATPATIFRLVEPIASPSPWDTTFKPAGGTRPRS
jgi:hypothetical protein